MLKKWLRKFLGIENELRGQKILNAKLLNDNIELEKRIFEIETKLKQNGFWN